MKKAILVIDDERVFVEATVDALRDFGFNAEGCFHPWKVKSFITKNKYDVILLDMHLGKSPKGKLLHASNVLIDIKTFLFDAKVIVFSQYDVGVEEVIGCFKRGACDFVPKSSDIADLIEVINVNLSSPELYIDSRWLREQLIKSLWDNVLNEKTSEKGKYLEMLMANIFTSMNCFPVLEANKITPAGEIDLIIANEHRGPFWRDLNSSQIIVECKNKNKKSELKDFYTLSKKIESRYAWGRIGVFVSFAGVTRGFKQQMVKEQNKHLIFFLDKNMLEKLLDIEPKERANVMRNHFQLQ